MPELPKLKLKATTAPPPSKNPFEYVLSDATLDRVGDVIEPAGWELDNFKKNPVALFSHNPDWPVGKWADVRVEKGRLLGRLELLDPVTPLLRHVGEAVKAGVLRAVSVGFVPLEDEPLKGSNSGRRYMRSELVEASLVSVPANPNALAIAKSLGLPPELIFGEFAGRGQAGSIGGLAGASNSKRKSQTMTPRERIETTQASINALRDELNAHQEGLGDDDVDGLAVADQLNERIAAEVRKLDTFQRIEASLGDTAEPPVVRQVPPSNVTVLPPRQPVPRPFAMPKKQESAAELTMHAITARWAARARGTSPEHILAESGWGDDARIRAIVDWQMRAATAPATTTTAGWAAELVQTGYADFLSALTIPAVYGRLSARGVSVTLGRNGQITMPTEVATPTISGSFVAEGAPIPVRQGAFGTFTIGLK